MIAPSTRLFGLVMREPREAYVARIYNYVLGFNGLDAAYLTFLAKPAQLGFLLSGFKSTQQTEQLHVVPAHQPGAAQWLGVEGRIDTLVFRPTHGGRLRHDDEKTWLDADHVAARALVDAREWFGDGVEAPDDLLAVLHETNFRPCKLTHDVFGKRPSP